MNEEIKKAEKRTIYASWRGKSRKKNKKLWFDWLKTITDLKCKRCGFDEWFVSLDFHHKDSKKKDFNFLNIWKYKPTEQRKKKIQEEIEKCIVLCANCHRPNHELTFTHKSLNNFNIMISRILAFLGFNTPPSPTSPFLPLKLS